jgi:hypothetical protein
LSHWYSEFPSSRNFDVENFFYYPFCRQKSKNNRYFGGLGILIKKDIQKGIKFLEDGNSEYQWLETYKRRFILGLHAIK